MPRRTSEIQVRLLSCDWGGITSCVNTFSAIQLNLSGYETQKSKFCSKLPRFTLLLRSVRVCLSVGSFDICRSRGRSRTLYDPAPGTITAERYLVLSVDPDSMNRDGLPRNCHISWHFLGSAILSVYFNPTDRELRLRRTAADGGQQCLSVKTLKTFLWIRWVVSPFTETILAFLLIVFLPS